MEEGGEGRWVGGEVRWAEGGSEDEGGMRCLVFRIGRGGKREEYGIGMNWLAKAWQDCQEA